MDKKQNNILKELGFNVLAKDYDDYFKGVLCSKENEIISILLRKWLIPGSVLDLGCGTGLGYELLPNKNVNYMGIDCSVKMVEIAKEKFSASFRLGDIRTMNNIPDSGFDNVISTFGSVNYIRDLKVAINRMHEVLKDDGRFFLMFMGHRYKDKKSHIINKLDKPIDFWVYNTKQLKHEFRRFRNVKIIGFNIINKKSLLKICNMTLDKIFKNQCYWLIVVGDNY